MRQERTKRPRPANLHLDAASAGYYGVLAIWQGGRVVIAAGGRSYAVQYRRDDGKWATETTAEDVATLKIALMYEPELAAAVELLPEYPVDAIKGVRHGWLPLTADQIEAKARFA